MPPQLRWYMYVETLASVNCLSEGAQAGQGFLGTRQLLTQASALAWARTNSECSTLCKVYSAAVSGYAFGMTYPVADSTSI